MEVQLLRWIVSVLYGVLTFITVADEYYFIYDWPLIIMAVGAAWLIVVNFKMFADKIYSVLIPLALIQIFSLIYEISSSGIDLWDQVIRLLFSIGIYVLFYFSKGKESVSLKRLFQYYFSLKLTENNKNKLSIFYAVAIGGNVGIALCSFLDAIFRDNGPYRVPFDKFMLFFALLMSVIFFILFIVCIARSDENHAWRLVAVLVVAAIVVVPSIYLWFGFLELIQTVKGIIYHDLLGYTDYYIRY